MTERHHASYTSNLALVQEAAAEVAAAAAEVAEARYAAASVLA